MTDIRQWQHAYAKQAEADLAAFHVLRQSTGLPPCLPLHCLQMTCEKLSKAYLCSTAKSLPELFLRQRALLKPRSLRSDSALLKQIKNLCREIEILAPTVDSQRRPDNCEYPWEDGAGVVVVPADHSFPAWSLHSEAAGQELLKVIPLAISALL